MHACPPCHAHQTTPTHYPRDVRRQGRHIDLIFGRHVHVRPLCVDPERRHTIDTDHAIVLGDLLVAGGRISCDWGNDSRARWVHRELPSGFDIVDEDDLERAGQNMYPTAKLPKHIAIVRGSSSDQQARHDKLPSSWKLVHRLRRAERKRCKLTEGRPFCRVTGKPTDNSSRTRSANVGGGVVCSKDTSSRS